MGIALSAPLTELTTPPFRATAVFGPVAAAAAVGRIRGLGVEPMRSALSLAASMAGGTSESFGAGTDEWHFQAGAAAAAGMMAAQLAEAKVTGSRTAFEADAGYLQCFARSGPSADTIADDLGATWNILLSGTPPNTFQTDAGFKTYVQGGYAAAGNPECEDRREPPARRCRSQHSCVQNIRHLERSPRQQRPIWDRASR